MTFPWLKGHGTENDFVLLPDHDGTIHGDLDPGFVAGLCHRRRGIGADGVLRVVKSAALEISDGSTWFMDYRNSDGSVSEMCGNGIRVFALHLRQEGLVDPAQPQLIGTRDGAKSVVFEDSDISADMGIPEIHDESKVTVEGRVWPAVHIETGNPHAVVFVNNLDDAGPLRAQPGYDTSVFPQGVNIEFVERIGARHIAMRVYERGSGETRSCGTGACAAAVAATVDSAAMRPSTWRVDVPGGSLRVDWRSDDHLILAGPAQINARGDMDWFG